MLADLSLNFKITMTMTMYYVAKCGLKMQNFTFRLNYEIVFPKYQPMKFRVTSFTLRIAFKEPSSVNACMKYRYCLSFTTVANTDSKHHRVNGALTQ